MLVVVVCYDRPHNLLYWQRAWAKMRRQPDDTLLFINTGDFTDTFDVEMLKLSNIGQDIGALQQLITTRHGYERLFWCADDVLPLRPDLLKHYRTHDLVGTFWSTMIAPHIRSNSFVVTEETANLLRFPEQLTKTGVNTKYYCYQFEYGTHNMYRQVQQLGKSIRMVDGTIPPFSPLWYRTGSKFMLDTSVQGYKRRQLRWCA